MLDVRTPVGDRIYPAKHSSVANLRDKKAVQHRRQAGWGGT